LGAGGVLPVEGMRRGLGPSVPVGGYERARPVAGRPDASQWAQVAETRALIAQFFIDLRQALRLTLPQAAQYLQVRPEVVEALETGQVEYLPPWSETAAIVMTYTSMAGVNGRPVLNAMGGLISYLSSLAQPVAQPVFNERHRPVERAQINQRSQLAPRPQSNLASRNFMRAGSVIASGARRLPQEALNQVRQRPQRALYALSLPLGLLLLMLHSSIFETVARPFGSAVRWVSTYFQEHYGPVRDGMRYIEVDDPRSRRGDKLQIGSGS
jgi:helix-turn-helix protein